MKFFPVIGIVILVLLSACHSGHTPAEPQKKVFEFKKVKTVSLPMDDPGYWLSEPQYAVIDGRKTIIIYIDGKRKLVFYDLDTRKKYHEIQLGITQLHTYQYINKDSIFLHYTNHGYVDTNQFSLIDYDGKVKRRYWFKNDIVWNSNNSLVSSDSAVYPSLLANSLEKTGDKFFFFLRKKGAYNIGTKEFMTHRVPVVSMYDLKTQKLTISKKMWYPYIKEGVYYPSDFNYLNYCMSRNGLPLIRYFYSSSLFEWDYRTDFVKQYTLKSYLIDTIMPMEKPGSSSENTVDAMYLSVSYDAYRKLYFSVLMFSPDYYGPGNWSMIIADENLRYIGEVYKPKMVSFSPVFTKDYILEVRMSKTGLNVNYYKLVEKNESWEAYIEKAKKTLQEKRKQKEAQSCALNQSYGKTDFTEYLKDKIIAKDDSDFTAVLVYAESGCPGCRETILKFVEYNKKVFNRLPFYLIISGHSAEGENQKVMRYNLISLKKLYLDTLGEMLSMTEKGSNKNPRLFVYKNDSMRIDSIYAPNDITTGLIPDLSKSLNLTMEEKKQ